MKCNATFFASQPNSHGLDVGLLLPLVGSSCLAFLMLFHSWSSRESRRTPGKRKDRNRDTLYIDTQCLGADSGCDASKFRVKSSKLDGAISRPILTLAEVMRSRSWTEKAEALREARRRDREKRNSLSLLKRTLSPPASPMRRTSISQNNSRENSPLLGTRRKTDVEIEESSPLLAARRKSVQLSILPLNGPSQEMCGALAQEVIEAQKPVMQPAISAGGDACGLLRRTCEDVCMDDVPWSRSEYPSSVATTASQISPTTSPSALDLDGIEEHEKVSVVFLDVMDYTFKSHELSAELSQEWLGSLHTAIEDSLLNHNVRRVETRSNCLICMAGTNITPDDTPETQMTRVVGFAREVNQALDSLEFAKLRFGVATGPVALSWMSSGPHAYPVVCAFGDVVNTAARMEATSVQGVLHMTIESATQLCAEKHMELPASIDVDRVKSKGWMETAWFACASNEFVARPVDPQKTLDMAAASTRSSPLRKRKEGERGRQMGQWGSFTGLDVHMPACFSTNDLNTRA